MEFQIVSMIASKSILISVVWKHSKTQEGTKCYIWRLPFLGMEETGGWRLAFVSSVAPVYTALEATACRQTLNEKVHCCWAVQRAFRGGVEGGGPPAPLLGYKREPNGRGSAKSTTHWFSTWIDTPGPCLAHQHWALWAQWLGRFSVCFPGTSW